LEDEGTSLVESVAPVEQAHRRAPCGFQSELQKPRGEPVPRLPSPEPLSGPPGRLSAGGPRCVHRLFGRLHRKYRHVDAALPFRTVLDASIDQREQRMVSADPNVGTGMPLRAALPHDDVTGDTGFAAEQFHAEALASRIAPVAR